MVQPPAATSVGGLEDWIDDLLILRQQAGGREAISGPFVGQILSFGQPNMSLMSGAAGLIFAPFDPASGDARPFASPSRNRALEDMHNCADS
jgi:hypothetical protein